MSFVSEIAKHSIAYTHLTKESSSRKRRVFEKRNNLETALAVLDHKNNSLNLITAFAVLVTAFAVLVIAFAVLAFISTLVSLK